ncbi:MAG TPA: FtsQ-type POTRA domain-containing protein [Terriglobales bacterium]|nr:FtsQ-type POTRA domain-containing protein [Terriglobales bacterium]
MARKTSPTILQEELYPLPGEPERGLDDARLVDLDVEEESPFLRGQKRVPARRGPLPKKTLHLLGWSAAALVFACVAGVFGAELYQYGERNWRFRIESSDDIEVNGTHNVPRAQIMEVLGGDIGRNIFFIPLTERKAQLEKIPWVESASVMRFVPNRLQIDIRERTPIAFARVGSRISLIDAGGTLMELPSAGKQKFSFPVIVGMNAGEPLSTRSARMKIYNQLLRELDADGGHYSQELSEVDISDQDDVKVLTNDPGGAVLVHLGSADFLSRYKIYVSHVQSWRQQFDKLESVDLRYDRQIIVNPDSQRIAKAPPLTPAAAKAAMAAGVKTAALIHVITTKKPSVADTPAVKLDKPQWEKASFTPPPAKPAPKKAHHRGKPKARAKKAAPKTAGKAATPDANKKPVAKATTTKAAASSAARPTPTQSKNKPSAAVAKNHDQQDHP